MKILLVDGTVIGRKTGVLLENIHHYLDRTNCGYQIELCKLEDYEHQIVDGRPLAQYNADMQKLVGKFEKADGFIFATPIFQGSIPGVLKNVFDLLHPHALRYKPVSIVANGGTYQHYLVVENQLKPILDYFRCLVTPNYVYTHSEHYNDKNELTDADVHGRLQELASVFVSYVEMSKRLAGKPKGNV